MTKLEEKIHNNLLFTKHNETSEQKAKRIADSVRMFLEQAWINGGVNATVVDKNMDYEQWVKKNNI